MSDHPIFIVGPPRSGTTLLASMLGGHSRIGCGPETQFFNKIGIPKLYEAVHDPAWPQRAVKLIVSLTLAGQRVHELFNLSYEDITCFLSKCDPSVRAMLESLTATYALRLGKPRWAEKTPNHLLYLGLIRKEFPQSPVVRIVRDPRDSALSMKKLPWASQSVLANCCLWDEWFQKSNSFFKYDDNALTVHYEDLVRHPRDELHKICYFIGEEFEPEMLNIEKAGQSVLSPNEIWKSQNTKPLSVTRVFVWKSELAPHLQDAATFCCLSGIREFGYEYRLVPTRTMQMYPFSKKIIENNEQVLIRLAGRGIHLIRSPNPFAAEELLVMPDLGTSNLRSRLIAILHFSSVLFVRYIRRRITLYLSGPPGSTNKHGKGLVANLIKLLGTRRTTEVEL